MKRLLLASAAIAFSASPAYAEHLDFMSTVMLENEISTSIDTDVEFDAEIDVEGDIEVDGDIDVDAAAIAVGDVKQITNNLQVIFDEGLVEGEPATLDNNADAGDVDADGNVGVNSAAGYYNTQANVATIAVSTGGDEGDQGGQADGMAQASTTGYQDLTATYYGPEFDDEGNDPYADTNTATVGAVGGDGNIGVNSAAGAFNQQQNIMTLAVASDSALSQSTAGVVQYNSGNTVILNDSMNMAEIGAVTGAGNIHVNAAAGVGNQQHNSLTVSAAGAFGGNGTGGTGNGGL